jgi:hypothetical protein
MKRREDRRKEIVNAVDHFSHNCGEMGPFVKRRHTLTLGICHSPTILLIDSSFVLNRRNNFPSLFKVLGDFCPSRKRLWHGENFGTALPSRGVLKFN